MISIGNRLRRDDGVAHAAVEQIRCDFGFEARTLQQLTPEVAEEIRMYEAVVFVDAEAGAEEPSIERMREAQPAPVISHVSTPEEIVALSRALFGFAGRAFLCRIPAYDFSHGNGLSGRANAVADRAARELENLLTELSEGQRV